LIKYLYLYILNYHKRSRKRSDEVNSLYLNFKKLKNV